MKTLEDALAAFIAAGERKTGFFARGQRNTRVVFDHDAEFFNINTLHRARAIAAPTLRAAPALPAGGRARSRVDRLLIRLENLAPAKAHLCNARCLRATHEPRSLNSGILPNGSSAELVSLLMAAS